MSHAVLSPSGAGRWLACTPSARLEEQFPDTAGEAAQEGTLAHALGELLLKFHTKQIKKAAFTKELAGIEADPLYSADMRNYADGYAAFVLERFAEAKKKNGSAVLWVEQKLDISDYVPDGFGTGDAVIISDDVLDIIDLKYGKGVPVFSENNKQMMLYALGALSGFDVLYDIHSVRMTIYQPRLDNISSWLTSVEYLKGWGETELKPRAALAFDGKGEFNPGDHCRFCKAKARCKALADDSMRLAAYDFKAPALLEDSQVADILKRADSFKKWISAVEDYAFTEALDSGKVWDGFKLVEGRSNRAYTDQDEVAKRLVESGYEEALLYTKSLLGITAMEKTISKKAFDEILGDLVIKPQDKPTLVPVTDKRPEWTGQRPDACTDFQSAAEDE